MLSDVRSRSSLVVVLALYCLGLAQLSVSSAAAAFPGENGKIAFVSTRDAGSEEIYTINPDGTDLQRLTNNGVSDEMPAWSADGDRIAFERGSAIAVMNADGSGQQQIATDARLPAWSPSGLRIAFARDQALWTMNADGSDQTPIAEMEDAVPAWAPSGARIAMSGCCFAPASDASSILTVNPGGDALAVLVDGGGSLQPNWSPDGSRIVFTSDNGLEVMTSGGGDRQVRGSCLEPAFSPQGDQIVCAKDGEIVIINADGTGTPTDVTTDLFGDFSPDWQPVPECSAKTASTTSTASSSPGAARAGIGARMHAAVRRGGRLRISAVVPGAAVAGSAVLLRGGGLSGKLKATIGGKRARVSTGSDGGVRIAVPKLRPGKQRIVVRRGKRSARARLRVLRPFDGTPGAKLDRANASTATIGPAGGNVAARGADGTSYLLGVPAGALGADVAITLTPVKRFTGLPLSGPDVAGARLSPDGLTLAVPATLTISGAGGFNGSTVGFGTGTEGFEVSDPEGVGRTLILGIDHFSDHGGGESTEADVANVLDPILDKPGNLSASAIRQLQNTLAIWDARFSAPQEQLFKPPSFCNRHEVCRRVVAKALRSFASLVNGACVRGLANPTFTSIAELLVLAGDQDALGATDIAGLDCVDKQLRSVVATAVAAVDADPLATFRAKELPRGVSGDINGDGRLSAFEFTAALPGEVSRMSSDTTLLNTIDETLDDALDRILSEGIGSCQAGRPEGKPNLLEGLAYATRLDRRQAEYLTALDACGVAVVVLPGAVELEVGAQRQFRAVLTANSLPDTDSFTWTATGGSITREGGLYTAPGSEGVFTVSATSTRFPAQSATAQVTVVAAGCGA